MILEDCIKQITRYQYLDFMRYPNVVAVGCGNKFIGGIDTGKLCIQVYVIKKYHNDYLGRGCIPSYYQGIQTDVIESGEIVINRKRVSTNQQVGEGFSKRIRPVKMGYNIGPYKPLETTEGSAGCIVTRTDEVGNLKFYILGNNHVLADLNNLPIGTPIVQPADGDPIRDSIAKLSEFVPLKFITPESEPENYVDAAIAEIDSLNLVRPVIAFMTIPKGVNINPKRGILLKASGSTSGYIIGNILSESSTTKVTEEGRHIYYVDQIISSMKSKLGDSGAAVLDSNNNVVGITSSSAKYTVINKISNIQNLLKVKVFTQARD